MNFFKLPYNTKTKWRPENVQRLSSVIQCPLRGTCELVGLAWIWLKKWVQIVCRWLFKKLWLELCISCLLKPWAGWWHSRWCQRPPLGAYFGPLLREARVPRLQGEPKVGAFLGWQRPWTLQAALPEDQKGPPLHQSLKFVKCVTLALLFVFPSARLGNNAISSVGFASRAYISFLNVLIDRPSSHQARDRQSVEASSPKGLLFWWLQLAEATLHSLNVLPAAS